MQNFNGFGQMNTVTLTTLVLITMMNIYLLNQPILLWRILKLECYLLHTSHLANLLLDLQQTQHLHHPLYVIFILLSLTRIELQLFAEEFLENMELKVRKVMTGSGKYAKYRKRHQVMWYWQTCYLRVHV